MKKAIEVYEMDDGRIVIVRQGETRKQAIEGLRNRLEINEQDIVKYTAEELNV